MLSSHYHASVFLHPLFSLRINPTFGIFPRNGAPLSCFFLFILYLLQSLASTSYIHLFPSQLLHSIFQWNYTAARYATIVLLGFHVSNISYSFPGTGVSLTSSLFFFTLPSCVSSKRVPWSPECLFRWIHIFGCFCPLALSNSYLPVLIHLYSVFSVAFRLHFQTLQIWHFQ